MEPLRVAVIGRTGRGDWGHAIDEVWAALDGDRTRLVAVADESQEGLGRAAARLGLDATKPGVAFRDWRAMLSAVRPDIVAICMRHVDCHAEMAIAAAEAGTRGIFMEKPFVRTPAEADAVVAACTKSGTKLSLAFVNRHSPAFLAARDLIEDGRIGKVLELRGRGKEDARGGGEDLCVLGCHILDMMAALAGGPRWCEATVTAGGRPITPSDAVDGPEGIGPIAGDSIAAMFGLVDGPIGYFASTRDAGLKQPNFGLTIAGTKGAIHIRPDHVPHAYLREAPLWRVDRDVPWRPIGPDGLGGDMPSGNADRAAERAGWARRAAVDLVAAIAEDREPETGMYAGRTTVEMIAAIYASAFSGTRIAWPLARSLASPGDPPG
ncbi:MAG: gfo/Idh/MocA family oxidoreductase [Planctomycetia bacterium]|nr:gfo/Idh/MocA family oxidoreductase [Planctomycetia bacterium]